MGSYSFILHDIKKKLYNEFKHFNDQSRRSISCINERGIMKDMIRKIGRMLKRAFGRKTHYTARYTFKTAKTTAERGNPYRRKSRLKPFHIAAIAIGAVACVALIIVLSITIKPQTKPTQDVSLVTASPTPIETPEPSAEPDLTSAPDLENGLSPDMHSIEVAKLQQRLMDLDYMETDDPTDFYGPQTKLAVWLFQRKHKLQVDGIAGSKTLKAIYAADAKHYTVYLQDQGPDVAGIQDRLKDLGYLKTKSTGLFGTSTASAVKAFQKRNNLAADGNVGENTREVLYSDDAKKAVATPSTNNPTTSTSYRKADKPPNAEKAAALVEFAKQQLGKTYVRGGKGPDNFDCSGFVYYCLNNIGMNIGYRTSGGWAKSSWPRVTNISDLMAGDIICFRGHVAICIGGGQMIDASSSQGQVRITAMSGGKYWKTHFLFGARVL